MDKEYGVACGQALLQVTESVECPAANGSCSVVVCLQSRKSPMPKCRGRNLGRGVGAVVKVHRARPAALQQVGQKRGRATVHHQPLRFTHCLYDTTGFTECRRDACTQTLHTIRRGVTNGASQSHECACLIATRTRLVEQ